MRSFRQIVDGFIARLRGLRYGNQAAPPQPPDDDPRRCPFCGSIRAAPVLEPDPRTGRVRVGIVSCCKTMTQYALFLRNQNLGGAPVGRPVGEDDD